MFFQAFDKRSVPARLLSVHINQLVGTQTRCSVSYLRCDGQESAPASLPAVSLPFQGKVYLLSGCSHRDGTLASGRADVSLIRLNEIFR